MVVTLNMFNSMAEFRVNKELRFDIHDYEDFVKSPVGNRFSDKKV